MNIGFILYDNYKFKKRAVLSIISTDNVINGMLMKHLPKIQVGGGWVFLIDDHDI